jgi:outer membrane protein, heavy metal efflux system
MRNVYLRAAGVLLICLAPAWPQTGGGTPAGPMTLSLEDAIRLALQQNQALRAQRMDVDQSKANEITASLKPNPNLSITAEDFPFFSPSFLTWDNLRTNQEFAGGLDYTFERGGKRAKRMLVAADSTAVVRLTVADSERQLRYQVAQAFIAVLLAKSNLELANASLKDFSNVVEINRQRADAGDISEADYLKIALQKLQFQQDVSAAQLSLVQSKATLRQLVGYQSVPENFDVSGQLEHKKQVVELDDLERRALQMRPDLLAVEGGVKAANDTVALALGDRARDLTAEAEYKRNGEANTFGFGLSFELPVHDRNQGEIARSQVAARQAQEAQKAATSAVLTDVVNAYSAFRTNDQIVSIFESGYLDQANRSREISRYAYRRGATSLLDFLDAERSYRETQLAFRQALANYMAGGEQINFAVGTEVIR